MKDCCPVIREKRDFPYYHAGPRRPSTPTPPEEEGPRGHPGVPKLSGSDDRLHLAHRRPGRGTLGVFSARQRTLPRLVDNLNPTRRYVIAFRYKLQPRQCKELIARLLTIKEPYHA